MARRGLEVRLTQNLGPHTKYFPFVKDVWDGESALVTSDDDMLYSADWLLSLCAAHTANPRVVNCFRAHVFEFDGDGVRPYANWAPSTSMLPGGAILAPGCPESSTRVTSLRS